MRTEPEIRDQVAYHLSSLAQWESGYLAPTEPDEEERTLTKERLKAAIWTLQWVLGEQD